MVLISLNHIVALIAAVEWKPLMQMIFRVSIF